MKVKTTLIDNLTGELSVEEWELPLFGPDTFARAFYNRSTQENGPSPVHYVRCPHWDYILSDINMASIVVKEYRGGVLAQVCVGFAEVIEPKGYVRAGDGAAGKAGESA